MFNMIHIGKNIARLRRGLDMTQVALADRMGVSCQAVSLWETGKSMPDIAKLPDLAAIFGVTIDELLGKSVPAVTHAIAGDLLARAADGTVTIDDLSEAAPILPPSQLNEVIPHLSARTDLTALLPFLDTETVDEMMMAQAAANQSIHMYFPFASEEAIDRLMVGRIRAGQPVYEFFPFASAEAIDRMMTEQARAGHTVCEFFPFASKKTIDRMMMEQLQAGHDVSAYLPFASEETIRQALLLRLQQSGSIDEFLPFLPDDILKNLALAAMKK